MLAATIYDKEKDLYMELHIDGNRHLQGYSVENGTLTPIKMENFKKYTEMLFMGPKSKKIKEIDEYSIYIDEDTNFVHFYKDGKPDYDKFLAFNGRETTMYAGNYEPYTGRRRIKKLSKKGVDIIVTTALFLDLAFAVISTVPIPIKGELVVLEDAITYMFTSEDEDKFSSAVSVDDIKNLILENENLSDEVKRFLWNKELIEDIVPYYDDTALSVISKIRHYFLNIEPFSEKEAQTKSNLSGYYYFDSTLHVKDYDTKDFKDVRETTEHEYIHLLQSSTVKRFIAETITSIISSEYYMDDGQEFIYLYSYTEPCRYLKALMEIIGPKPVWENSFKNGSTALEDAVKPYLTDLEFQDFEKIMDLHPYYDEEELTNMYPRFREILKSLYKNIYAYDLEDDPIITTILDGEITDFSRFYFKTSGIEKDGAYYKKDVVIPLEDAIADETLTYCKEEYVSKEAFFASKKEKYIKVRFQSPNEIFYELVIQNGKFVRYITTPDKHYSGSIEKLYQFAQINDRLDVEQKTNEQGEVETLTIRFTKPLDDETYVYLGEMTIDKDNNIVSFSYQGKEESVEEEDHLQVSYVTLEKASLDEIDKYTFGNGGEYFFIGQPGSINTDQMTYTMERKQKVAPITTKFPPIQEKRSDFTF